MWLKPGVKIDGIKPELLLAIIVAEEVYRLARRSLVITSVKDGKHMKGSLHYSGSALDLRIYPEGRVPPGQMAKEIQNRLGKDFDVILEPDHIHIEYQPKATSGPATTDKKGEPT